MRLVVDNSNIVELDTPNYGNVVRLIGILERDDGLAIVRLGEITTAYELMGLFEAAKLRVFADDVIED